MFQLHRERILRDESLWGINPDGTAGRRNLIDEVNGDSRWDDLPEVQTISESLDSAKNSLIEQLKIENPVLANLDATAFLSTNIYLDPGRDSNGQTHDPNHNSILDGSKDSSGADKTGNEILIGEGGNDKLIGGKGSDILLGGDGDDTLIGGPGADTLIGGAGDDTYIFNVGDNPSQDKIIDSDGRGRIIVKDENTFIDTVISGIFIKDTTQENTWRSADGKVVITHNSPYKITLANGTTIQLGDNLDDFHDGDYGIHLKDASGEAIRTIVGDMDFGADGKATDDLGNPIGNVTPGSGDYLRGSSGNDRIQGLGGQDVLRGQGGDDILEGGAGSDILVGGAGDDRLYVDSETDLAQAIDTGRAQNGSGNKGDWLNGGDGDDIIVAGADNDVLLGGHGRDILVAGAGDDYLNGDDDWTAMQYTWYTYNPNDFNWAVTDYGNPFDRSVGPTNVDSPPSGAADVLYAGAGNDFLWGGFGDDVLYGESGNDTLAGGHDSDMLFGGDGDDRMTGDYGKLALDSTGAVVAQGDDYLDGGAGNDWIQGEGGNDTLIGGSGDDEMWGDAKTFHSDTLNGEDCLDGGDGNDTLVGQGGNDELFGGAGDDQLFGDADDVLAANQGDDYLDGEDGNDYLRGYGGKDTLFGGAGNDTLLGEDGDDYLDGEDGNDVLDAGAGNDELFGGKGDDSLNGGTGDDYLDGEDGNNNMYGGVGNDTLHGGTGDDYLQGDAGNDYLDASDGKNMLFGDDGDDTLIAGSGDDQMDGGAGNDFLSGGDGNDQMLGNDGDDTLDGGTGDDVMFADTGTDVLLGGDGADQMHGGDGNDSLIGGSGDDILFGDDGDDTLDGGSGTDYLDGGAGNNAYIVHDQGASANGVAHTTIANNAGRATIVFDPGVTADSISFVPVNGNSGNSADFALRFGSGDTIYLTNGLQSNVLSALEFADGTVMTRADIMALAPRLNVAGGNANDDILGGDQADTLGGGAGDDRIAGGKGNDTLTGGLGNDTYVFNSGDGQDLIDNAATDNAIATDTIAFGSGIAAADVVLNRVGNDLLFKIGAADRVTVKNYFLQTADNKIDQVRFADNTVWNRAFIESNIVTGAPTSGADTLTGFDTNDIIHGESGDDTIYAGAGDDKVFGEAGYDSLYGEGGNDILDPGADGALMIGGDGSDTYLFARGDGWSRIRESGSAGDVDTILVAPDISPADLIVKRDYAQGGATVPEDLLIYTRQPNSSIVDAVTVEGFFATQNNAGRIEQIQFADGTVWDVNAIRAMVGVVTDGNDTVLGYNWDDSLNGRSGNDNIQGFAGNDMLVGGDGADTVDGGTGNDLITGDAGNDLLSGGLGDDTLDGGAGDDQLCGYSSSDTYNGVAGNDTYVFGTGYGSDWVFETAVPGTSNDTLKLNAGIAPADLTLYREEDHLVITINSTQDQFWIASFFTATRSDGTAIDHKIERFAFADGSVWDAATIASKVVPAPANAMTGTAGNDTFVIDNVLDTVTEGVNQGIDTIQSSVTYTAGPNVENLILTGKLDIWGGGNELNNIITGNSGKNTLYGYAGNDTIRAGAGDDYVSGGAGADAVYGEAGNDTLYADGGIDTLFGGTGDDTYVFDYLPNGASYAGTSVVEAAGEGIDTIKTVQGAIVVPVNVENMLMTSNSVNAYFTGNALDNTLTGNIQDDYLDGAGGVDMLIGGAGNDVYVVDDTNDVVVEQASYGGGFASGYDTVRSTVSYTLGANVERLILVGNNASMGGGNDLDNTLNGSNFDDPGPLYSYSNDISYTHNNFVANVLFGGKGNDKYYLGRGDTVVENLNEGIDTVYIADQFSGKASLKADYANVENLVLLDVTGGNADIEGSDVENSLTGNNYVNRIEAGAGNDTLIGLGGDDWLDGGTGIDTMTGGDGNDTYVVDNAGDIINESGTGVDTVRSSVSIVLGTNLENLVLTGDQAINGTGNVLNNTLDGSQNSVANVLAGGAGNDTYILGTGDTIVEAADGGIDTILSSISATLFDNVENITLTGSNAVSATGNAGNNILDGSQNSAANTLIGGAGDDTYIVDSGDFVVEVAGGGNDTIVAVSDYILDDNVENLILQSGGHGVGNASDNVLTGALYGDNVLDGGAGADRMIGGYGRNTYYVDNVSDIVENSTTGTDTVLSSVSFTLGQGIDFLTLTGTADISATGNSDNNILTGNDGANVLTGGTGGDLLVGGKGGDTYVFNAGDGTDTIDNTAADNSTTMDVLQFGSGIAASGVTLARNGGDLVVKISASDSVTVADYFASDSDQKIDAIQFADGTAWSQAYIDQQTAPQPTAGADSLVGCAGDDVIHGLGGNDTISGGTGNDQLFGDAGNDVLNGDAGDDMLDGGTGSDQMRGGTGNDLYVVDSTTDTVTENLNEGIDTVQSAVTWTLGNNMENLTLTGSSAINGTGNALGNALTGNSAANTLTGGAGDDTLDGGAGADKLIGGAGNDVYIVDNTSDAITENAGEGADSVKSSVSCTLASNVENLILTGSAAINGTGNILSNVLTGNDAANTLDGGSGADTMAGGVGNDTYIVDNVGDVVIENANEGTDIVKSSITYTLTATVENLTLTGATAINGTGNELDNVLTGNSATNILTGGTGNDTLDGRAGADKMLGGTGNDTYVVDNSSDVVTENAGEGVDQVNSSITYTLTTNVEALTLTGTSTISGTGNASDNLLVGNSAANILNGSTGNDIMQGAAGNDTLTDTVGNNMFDGGAGADTVTGGAGNEFIAGGAGNDTITTGVGADVIAFNRGDGQDVVNASTTKDNTISLGKGIKYVDLQFKKSSNDLILVTGISEQITFKDWYASTSNHSVKNMQIVIEGTTDYDATSTNAMNNKKIEQFDFDGLVTKFDQARVANPSLTSWALSSALLNFYLEGSDTAAIGGDLAYQYARNGNWSNMSMTPAQALLANSQFGTGSQNLQQPGALLDASPRLQ